MRIAGICKEIETSESAVPDLRKADRCDRKAAFDGGLSFLSSLKKIMSWQF
jgi:hypothetical protein